MATRVPAMSAPEKARAVLTDPWLREQCIGYDNSHRCYTFRSPTSGHTYDVHSCVNGPHVQVKCECEASSHGQHCCHGLVIAAHVGAKWLPHIQTVSVNGRVDAAYLDVLSLTPAAAETGLSNPAADWYRADVTDGIPVASASHSSPAAVGPGSSPTAALPPVAEADYTGFAEDGLRCRDCGAVQCGQLVLFEGRCDWCDMRASERRIQSTWDLAETEPMPGEAPAVSAPSASPSGAPVPSSPSGRVPSPNREIDWIDPETTPREFTRAELDRLYLILQGRGSQVA